MSEAAFNSDNKFDIDLAKAQVCEADLLAVFESKKVELKSERHIWETTGNICIEYKCRGKWSGIATTQADFWFHELRDKDDKTLIYFCLPVNVLRNFCRLILKNKDKTFIKKGIGDDGESDAILIPINNIQIIWNYK